MKTPFLLALPTIIACCAFAQERLEQPARTRLQCTTADKTITPLAGVQVKVENLLFSGADGKLTLSITPNKDKTYSFAQIQKSGYALIHPRPEDIAGKKSFAHNANAELDIILRDDADLEEEQDKYAAQGKSYYLQRQKQLKQEVEAAQSPELKQKLIKELDWLIERREQIMKDIEARARELASTDYLALDEDEIKRIELRKAGKLDELIELINTKLAQDPETYAKELKQNIQAAQQREVDAQLEEEELIAKRNEQIKLLGELADVYAEQFNYQKAADCLKDRLLYAPDDYQCHMDYARLIQEYLASYAEALEVYSKCAQLAKQQYGEECDELAASYNNIGGVYYNQGEYAKALEYYLKDLAISEKVLGKEHPDTATSYNNIGGVYDAQGEYAKALEYYLKSLMINEKVLGIEHLSTATSYNNIGGVYDAQGEYAKALEYHLKALAIKEKVLGKNHPSTATSYNNIGNVYYAKGNNVKALECHLKALAIEEKVLGKNHPSIATSYNNIGFVCFAQGEYAKALEYHLNSLAICEKVLGQEHPDTAVSYNNIGSVYNAQGEYAKALEYFLKDLEIREKVLGTEHPDTATSYNNIGFVYYKQDNHVKALEYHLKSLAIREKVLGTAHPDTAISYNNIGKAYLALGDKRKALAYLDQSLLIFQRTLGKEHPNTKHVQKNRDELMNAASE